MMNDARALATKRMVEEAESMGADAVVNIRLRFRRRHEHRCQGHRLRHGGQIPLTNRLRRCRGRLVLRHCPAIADGKGAMMKRVLKRVLGILLILIILLTGAFAVYVSDYYRADETATKL